MRYLTVILSGVYLLTGCTTTSSSFTTPYSTASQDSVSQEYNRDKAAETRLSLGLRYLGNGDYEKAKLNLDKALEHQPDSEDVLRGMAWYYEQVNENKLAEEYYQKALKINNKNPSLLNQYGVFLCRNGKLEQSLELFMASAKILTNRDISGTYENAATCNLMAGNQEQAEQYFRRALNHNPEQKDSLLGMAEIEFGKGRFERTRSYLRRFEAVAKHTPRSLWLAVRNAHKMVDLDSLASYGLKLEQLFPDSQETENYLDNKRQWLR